MQKAIHTDLMKDPQLSIMSMMYLSGKSLKEVSKRVGIGRTRIYHKLLDYGTPIRKSRKYSCNDQFFKVIDSEEKAYWLGFLAADGCVLSKRPVISLHLSSEDRSHLEKFRRDLDSNNPIYSLNTKNEHPACGIHIQSKEMKADLMDKGVVPRKSLILKSPQNVPDHLIHHWIRGYFDGDGCIHFSKSIVSRKRVIIVGTKKILEFIKSNLKGIGGSIRKCPDSKAFSYKIGAQADVKRFADYIYKDANTFLERKWLRFQA